MAHRLFLILIFQHLPDILQMLWSDVTTFNNRGITFALASSRWHDLYQTMVLHWLSWIRIFSISSLD